jgi:hypothetical protein
MDMLTLADPGLIAYDGGHAYVFSRMPDKVELMPIVGALSEHEGRYGDDVGSVGYDNLDKVVTTGLNVTARPVIEEALFDGLMGAFDAMALESATWQEEKALDRAAAEAEVRASFDRLPLDLP